MLFVGAAGQIRTADLILTKDEANVITLRYERGTPAQPTFDPGELQKVHVKVKCWTEYEENNWSTDHDTTNTWKSLYGQEVNGAWTPWGDEYYTIGEVQEVDDKYQCVVTLKPEKWVAMRLAEDFFENDTAGHAYDPEHTRTNGVTEVTFTYDAAAGMWSSNKATAVVYITETLETSTVRIFKIFYGPTMEEVRGIQDKFSITYEYELNGKTETKVLAGKDATLTDQFHDGNFDDDAYLGFPVLYWDVQLTMNRGSAKDSGYGTISFTESGKEITGWTWYDYDKAVNDPNRPNETGFSEPQPIAVGHISIGLSNHYWKSETITIQKLFDGEGLTEANLPANFALKLTQCVGESDSEQTLAAANATKITVDGKPGYQWTAEVRVLPEYLWTYCYVEEENATISGYTPAGTTGWETETWQSDTAEHHYFAVELKDNQTFTITNSYTKDTVPAPNLVITKSAPKGVKAGGDVEYTITVENTGSAEATNVVVTDTLPQELAGYITKSTPSCNLIDGVYSWKLGTIKVGEQKEITLTAPTTTTGITKNKAQVTSDEIADPVPSNEVETKIYKLVPTKSHDKNIAVDEKAGTATITYTVTIKNDSGFDLYGLDIIDTLKKPEITSGSATMKLIPRTLSTTDTEVQVTDLEAEFDLSSDEATTHTFPALNRNTVFKDQSTVTLTYDVVITRTSTEQLVLRTSNTAYGGCWTAAEPITRMMRAAARSGGYDAESDVVNDSAGTGDDATVIIPPPDETTHTITVSFVTEDEEEVGKIEIPVKEGENYDVTEDAKKIPEGYESNSDPSGDPVTGTADSDKKVIVPVKETITPSVEHTVTIRYQDDNGRQIGEPIVSKFAENDPYDVSESIKAPDGYAIISITGDPVAGKADSDKTITVICGEDAYGPTGPNDPTKKDESDGVPDKYQAVVTYMVEGGTWDGMSDKTNREYAFTLWEKDEDGTWAKLTGDRAPKLGTTVPNVANAAPDSDHIAAGKGWRNPAPDAAAEVTGDATYIYSFPSKNPFTVTFVDGLRDVTIETKTVTVFPNGSEYPTPPEHDGYCFDHWSTPVSDENGTYTVTALYVKQITVTWVDENGSTVGGPIIIDENSDYSEQYPAAPEGPGHWGNPEKDDNGNITIRWIPENVDPAVRTIWVDRVDEEGNLLSRVEVPNVPVTDTQFTLTSEQAPSVLNDGGNRYIRTDALGTVPIPENGIITVRYALDNIGGGMDGRNPDGIPDNQEAVVYYSTNNAAYGTVSSAYQVFDLGSANVSRTVTLRNTASTTTLSRTYFIDWIQGGSVLDRDEDLRTDFTVAGGQTYTVTANFGRRAAGGGTGGTGGGTGGGTTTTPPTTIPDTPAPLDPGTSIDDQEVPLAGTVGLNNTDHFAYVIGYPDDTVHPLGNITRAEVATIFFRLMTEDFRVANWSTTNSFTDVKEGDWYNNAVSTCAKAGILKGREDGRFDPNASITRAEFAAIAARFLDESYTDDGTGDFADTANHWAAKEIRLAAKAGWIYGIGNSFNPEARITRAEVMTIVNRMLDRTPDKDHMLPEMKKWIDNPEDAWYYEAVQEATNEHDYTRDESSVETWSVIKDHRDWAALELGWAANNGASAPKAETETQSLPDGI